MWKHEVTVHHILTSVKNSKRFWMKTEAEDDKDLYADEEEEEDEEEKGKIGGKVQKQEAKRLHYIDWYSMNHEYSRKTRFSEAWFKFLDLELSQEMVKLVIIIIILFIYNFHHYLIMI